MSNQPSTSDDYHRDWRWDESFDSGSDDGDLVRFATPTETPKKNSPQNSPQKNRLRWDNESDDSDEEEETKIGDVSMATADEISNQELQEEQEIKQRNNSASKRLQGIEAKRAQAAEDLKHQASMKKRKRPLNQYVQDLPSPRECRQKTQNRKDKCSQQLQRMREAKLDIPPAPYTGKGSLRSAPSTRAVDRTGMTTVWEQRKVVFYVSEEQVKQMNARAKKRIRPRTGPAANNGIYAMESRREMEKKEEYGFRYSTQKIKKDSEDSSDDEEPKSRNHSGAVVKILEEEFEKAQYLDVMVTRKLVRMTKLKPRQISDWFANNRRKIQQKFRKGEIEELPKQMKALDDKNKERERRGEHLKMRDLEDNVDDGQEVTGPDKEMEDSDDGEDAGSEIQEGGKDHEYGVDL